jgi:hypothetical protein
MNKAAKRKVQRTDDEMTTEQLAKKVAKDVKQMSNVEKAKVSFGASGCCPTLRCGRGCNVELRREGETS